HVVVLRLPESAAQRFGNSNHFVSVRLHTKGLSERIHSGEKLGGQIRSDEHDLGMVFLIRWRDETSLRGVKVANFGKVRSGAEHLDVFHGQIATFHLNEVILFRSHSRGELHAVAEAHIVVVINQRALLCFDPLILTGNDAEAVNEKDVRAEIGNAIGHIHVEAGNYAHDGNEGGNCENHTQEREEAAELVGTEGAQGQFQSFAEGNESRPETPGAGLGHHGTPRYRRDTGQATDAGYSQSELLIS